MIGQVIALVVALLFFGVMWWLDRAEWRDDGTRLPDEEVVRRLEETLERRTSRH